MQDARLRRRERSVPESQPQVLYDHLTCRKTMVRFTTAEGAGAHCQIGASRLAFARIFDWLDETMA